MKHRIGAAQMVYGLTIGLLSTTLWVTDNRSAQAQSGECYAPFQGQTLYLFNGAFDDCVRAIRAAAGGAQYGVGTWGGLAINTDATGNTYVNPGDVNPGDVNPGDGQWQYVGVVRNVSGTVGSLQDQCGAGDEAACNQWGQQTDQAIEQLQRMYPSGWFQ